MHPDLCRFVSDAFYDGRLLAEAGNERQQLILEPSADPALAPTGLRFISIEHEGFSQKSEPEADRVRQLYQSLLTQRWTDREGQVHRIGVEDILVASPYNMQVNLLRSRLPEGARVGTVDRFQGQQAAVVLISMATSSGPRESRASRPATERSERDPDSPLEEDGFEPSVPPTSISKSKRSLR